MLPGSQAGAAFAPTRIDWPMFFHGCPVTAEPDTAFFLNMIPEDSDSGTATGCEVLSRSNLDPIVA